MVEVANLRVPYVLLRDSPTFRYIRSTPVVFLKVTAAFFFTFCYAPSGPERFSRSYVLLRASPTFRYIQSTPVVCTNNTAH